MVQGQLAGRDWTNGRTLEDQLVQGKLWAEERQLFWGGSMCVVGHMAENGGICCGGLWRELRAPRRADLEECGCGGTGRLPME